jgi:hypothetical protein
MFIKPRKVNRSSKFTPRWVATARRKKEQAASLYSTAVIQLVLSFFLLIGAFRSYQAIMVRNPDLSLFQKAAVPGFFLIAAIFFIRAGIKNLLEAREIRRPDPEDGIT